MVQIGALNYKLGALLHTKFKPIYFANKFIINRLIILLYYGT
jgi:hypothetical protein